MTHPRRTLGKLEFKHSKDTVFQENKKMNKQNSNKAGAKGKCKRKLNKLKKFDRKEEEEEKEEECGLAFQWHLCLLLDHAT